MKNIFLVLILLMVNSFTNAQSCTDVKELLRKRHTISGMTYGHPYTMFDRHNGLSLDSIISNIRIRIIREKRDSNGLDFIFQAYKSIYTNAAKPRPTDDGKKNGDGYSALDIWAKNNAFVFLVGMDANGKLI